MSDSGWIKLDRSIIYSSIFTAKVEYFKIWIFILASVSHCDTKFPFNGEDIFITSGSFITGRKVISKKCDVSDQTVRSALEYLKSTSRITIKSTNKFSVISVNNWNDYQQSNQQSNKPATSQQPASNHNQELKELKNVKNKYSTLDSLTDLVLQEISTEYKVPLNFVVSKRQDMIFYCESQGKNYKDYKMALLNWVKRDAIKLKDQDARFNNKTATDLSHLRGVSQF